MAESLMIVPGELPILTVVDDALELEGAVALDDNGSIDSDATERLTHLLAIARPILESVWKERHRYQ